MIVDIPNFESCNKVDHLPDGTYVQLLRTYINYHRTLSASLYEYRLVDLPAIALAYDLVVVLENGDVLFRDFAQLADGDWRDSYGRRAPDIEMLFPEEMANFRSFGEDVESIFTLKNGEITLLSSEKMMTGGGD